MIHLSVRLIPTHSPNSIKFPHSTCANSTLCYIFELQSISLISVSIFLVVLLPSLILFLLNSSHQKQARPFVAGPTSSHRLHHSNDHLAKIRQRQEPKYISSCVPSLALSFNYFLIFTGKWCLPLVAVEWLTMLFTLNLPWRAQLHQHQWRCTVACSFNSQKSTVKALRRCTGQSTDKVKRCYSYHNRHF